MEQPTMVYGSHVASCGSGSSPVISDDENESGCGAGDGDADGNTPLPDGYTPSSSDCICARGKAYWDHPGNQRYRDLITAATPQYAETTNKLEKTLIVSEIVEAIHKAGGKFIKKIKKGGPFVVVSEVFAREKVGQSLRDGLSTKYKSATKFKKQRKPKPTSENNTNNNSNNNNHSRLCNMLDADKIVTSNRYVCQRIDELKHQVASSCGELASDASIMTLFSRTNSDILESIKRDNTMLQQFVADNNNHNNSKFVAAASSSHHSNATTTTLSDYYNDA